MNANKQIVVIAGPSGSGKNTLIRELMASHSGMDVLVTATTRMPRAGEIDGKDYYFFSQERFDQELMAGDIVGERFVPLFGGTHYGIYLPDLRKRLLTSKIIFAPVDIIGAHYLKETYDATTIFLMPESVEAYRRRIRVRNPDMSQMELDLRMKITETEMRVHAPQFDYRVVSADGAIVDVAAQVMDILHKEGYNLA
jgi:guanylate kinase